MTTILLHRDPALLDTGKTSVPLPTTSLTYSKLKEFNLAEPRTATIIQFTSLRTVSYFSYTLTFFFSKKQKNAGRIYENQCQGHDGFNTSRI